MNGAHLTTTEIESFATRQLEGRDLLRADEHLESCERCRAALLAHLETLPASRQSVTRWNRVLRAADPHPEFEQLLSRVDR